MTAREAESALLARCSVVAREAVQFARDQREANVFRLAAMLVRSHFPSESRCLLRASERTLFRLAPERQTCPGRGGQKGVGTEFAPSA